MKRDRRVDSRDSVRRNLHSKVAASDHNSVTLGDNLVYVPHRRRPLDLANDLDLLVAEALETAAHLADILRIA